MTIYLATNSNLNIQSQVDYHGQSAYKWNKKGLQNNYYYETIADNPKDRVLLEIDQQPNDDQIFEPKSRNLVIKYPEEIFKLPSYCEAGNTCSFFSTCHAVG